MAFRYNKRVINKINVTPLETSVARLIRLTAYGHLHVTSDTTDEERCKRKRKGR